jgi:hypothetical protein
VGVRAASERLRQVQRILSEVHLFYVLRSLVRQIQQLMESMDSNVTVVEVLPVRSAHDEPGHGSPQERNKERTSEELHTN